MTDKDVTDKVDFREADGECLPLVKCVCGKRFDPWDCILNIYREMPWQCECGRKLYFRNSIRVYEIGDTND